MHTHLSGALAPVPEHPTAGVPLPVTPFKVKNTNNICEYLYENLGFLQCPKIKEFHACGTACPPTCENPSPTFCPLSCNPG